MIPSAAGRRSVRSHLLSTISGLMSWLSAATRQRVTSVSENDGSVATTMRIWLTLAGDQFLPELVRTVEQTAALAGFLDDP